MTSTTTKGMVITAALVALGILTLSTLLIPPTVYIPQRIAAQWDSIWRDNLPKNCSAENILCAPKEFLGCVQIERTPTGWYVRRWEPAANMIRLPLAASGDCLAGDNAMWHIHPATVDPVAIYKCVHNSIMCNFVTDTSIHLRFYRDLSGDDLETLWNTPGAIASLMTWAPGYTVGAIVWRHKILYPAKVVIQ